MRPAGHHIDNAQPVDAVGPRVMPEEMAGHADLAAAAAAGAEHLLIEPKPVIKSINAGGLRTGKGDRHYGDSCGHTAVLSEGYQPKSKTRLAQFSMLLEYPCRAAPGRWRASPNRRGGAAGS